MTARLSHPKYRRDIDGLRAIAVLSVVAYHAFPNWMKGGFIGVDVFFVISGFLISTIIFENLDKGTFSFAEFYARRIRRIFPSLILVLVACFAFGWFVLLPDEFKQLGKHIAGGAALVSNFVLWNESGYFDNAADTKPLLHLWSLGVEEQFYVVWPLLLWLSYKRVSLLAIGFIVAVISFYLNIKQVKTDVVADFYSPQTRFWELMSGSILAWITLYRPSVFTTTIGRLDSWLAKAVSGDQRVNDGTTLANAVSILAFLMLGYGFWRIDKDVGFPGKWAVIPVLGAVLIIFSGCFKAWVNRTILSSKVAVWFGLISFPLYLWHLPLLSFARIVESEVPSRNIRILAVVLSVVLAWLTYEGVERPLRFGKHGMAKVALLVALMAIVGCVGYNTFEREGLKFRSGIQSLNSVNAEFVGPLWQYTKNEVCQRKYPLAGSENYRWWFCMASSEKKPTLLLLGNSYANQFYPGIVLNQHLNHHSVLSIGACDAGWVDESGLSAEVNSHPCSGRRALDQLQLINNLVVIEKSIKYAIIGGLSPAPTPEYIARLKRRIDFLEHNGIKVIIFTPHVRIDYDIKGCYARPLATPKKDCQVSLDVYRELKRSFMPLIDSIKQTNPDVLFFDQNLIFCGEYKCNFRLPMMPAFRDQYAHLSAFASKLLFEKFVEWAKTNVPEILE